MGAGNQEDDGGYTAKVLAEHNRLRQVSNGRALPFSAAPVIPVSTVPQPKPATPDTEQVALLTP